MRLQQLQNQYLYEGLDRSDSNSMMLWESAGFKLKEAALTADQIQQIFQSVEQGATDAGGNRTMLGKGKDAAEAVNKAWEDLKTKIQNSGPIKNVDNAYDSAVAKIEAGLGGPDNAVSKVIMGYRKFAKEHPIAQGFIYSALIAAAGISGAGLGGAAVLGLLKMADKLLQGEKFSSAAYSGAKTGAMAYGASKLGDYLKGKPDAEVPAGAPDAGLDASLAQKNADMMKAAAKNAYHDGTPMDAMNGMSAATANAAKNLSPEQLTHLTNLGKQGSTAIIQNGRLWIQDPSGALQMLNAPRGVSPEAMLKIVNRAAGTESIAYTGKRLSEGQVYLIFNRVAREDIMEGPMDAIKGMAGKAANWAATKGKNLTTKVTADKLNSAWKAAGSPMDSDQVAAFLQSQGVDAGIVDKVYADLKLPAAGDPKKDPTLDPEKGNAGGASYADVKKLIMALTKKDKQRMMQYVKKQLGTA